MGTVDRARQERDKKEKKENLSFQPEKLETTRKTEEKLKTPRDDFSHRSNSSGHLLLLVRKDSAR